MTELWQSVSPPLARTVASRRTLHSWSVRQQKVAEATESWHITKILGSGIVADPAAGTISEQADGLLSIQSEQDNSTLVSKQPRYTPLPRAGPGEASEGREFFS